MVRVAARIVLLAGFAAGIACGPSNDVVNPADDLLEAPAYDGEGASSSGSPVPPPPAGGGSSSGSGGGPNGFGTPDAGTPPTCGALWPMEAAVAVAGLPATAIRPSFSSDELTAYFVAPNANNLLRIYAATRASLTDPFQPAVEMGSNVNGGLESLAVSVAPSGLELVFNTYDGNDSQLLHATRAVRTDAFGPSSLLRANTILEVAARDDSVRFFARNVDGSTRMFQLRPGNAPDDQAVLLDTGVPTWFEVETGTLWFEQFFSQPTPGFYPRFSIWNGTTWGDNLPADMRVYWISLDGCRMYGVNADGIVVRTRVPPPT